MIFLIAADYRNFLADTSGVSTVFFRCAPDVLLTAIYAAVLYQIRRGVFPWRVGLGHGIAYVLLSFWFGAAWIDPSLFPVLMSSRAYVAALVVVLLSLLLNVFLIFSAARFVKSGTGET